MTTLHQTNLTTDEAILKDLGQRLARRRIDMGLTQANLAHEAGVSKRTVERIEAGGSAQFATLLRICRVLDLMGGLDQFIPPAGPRPMDMIRKKGSVRKRASSRRRTAEADEPWSWDP